jgi:acetylornithine deacetylase/succinyl-diaminopimelate desuccinylase-like protein
VRFRSRLHAVVVHAFMAAVDALRAQGLRIRSLGGTVPVSRFIDALGFPAMVIPIVNFDNNQHAPNENVRLGNLFRGVVIYAAILRM